MSAIRPGPFHLGSIPVGGFASSPKLLSPAMRTLPPGSFIVPYPRTKLAGTGISGGKWGGKASLSYTGLLIEWRAHPFKTLLANETGSAMRKDSLRKTIWLKCLAKAIHGRGDPGWVP